MATNTSQFQRIWVTPLVGGLTEISNYCNNIVITTGSNDTNVSTFAAGGGAVTETHIRGIMTAKVSADVLYDPFMANILKQLIGSRTGFLIQAVAGSNSVPGNGDRAFTMTATLLKVDWTYEPAKPSMLKVEFVPADNTAAVLPYFGTY